MKRIISKQLAVVFVGSFVALLGLLWFLQGAAILHLCPVSCVSNCECITSGSQFWEGAGAITLIIGITFIGAGVRLARKHRTKG
jgi:hypothetical protein